MEKQTQNIQTHLFGKPLAITTFDNTLIGKPSIVQIETRVASVATDEVICTITDNNIEKAKSKADLIMKAVNSFDEMKDALQKISDMCDSSGAEQGGMITSPKFLNKLVKHALAKAEGK